jgi:hypothetical protein
MKGKTHIKISATIAVLLLAMAMFAVFVPAHAASENSILYINCVPGAYKTVPTGSYAASVTGLNINQVFNVTLQLQNFTDLYGWQAGLAWNNMTLHLLSILVGDTQLPTNVFHVLDPSVTNAYIPTSPVINNGVNPGTLGYIAQALSGVVPGVNFTGTLLNGYNAMVFVFKVVGYGTSVIGITHQKCINSALASITPLTVINGTATTVAAPAPYGPKASFTVFPVMISEGMNVTCDASASTPGFDGTKICPITVYSWNFGDGTPIVNTTGTTQKHNYTGPVTVPTVYTINLTVYAPGATPVSNWTTHTVTVLPPPSGAQIDLTSNAPLVYGYGPNTWSNSFAPQELVILYAKVTYNGQPVSEKLVSFQVIMPNGTIIYRSNETLPDGECQVQFRIPNSPCFGDWMALAYVDVAQTVVGDTMPFYVGWIVYVKSITPTAGTFHLNTMATFNVTVESHNLTAQKVLLTFVIYDALGVPIGSYIMNYTTPAISPYPTYPTIPVVDSPVITITIKIPSWAYISTPAATIYGNSFTNLPSLKGVPTGPEASATFLIAA